jgi:hypothetical protein
VKGREVWWQRNSVVGAKTDFVKSEFDALVVQDEAVAIENVGTS